jgi:hypothetical protein
MDIKSCFCKHFRSNMKCVIYTSFLLSPLERRRLQSNRDMHLVSGAFTFTFVTTDGAVRNVDMGSFKVLPTENIHTQNVLIYIKKLRFP